jgi:AAA+ ATPase superfamily predicted ATPase
MRLIGRQQEQRELRRLYESGKPEFVVVYGRRRVGKTFLISQTFGDSFAFTATGTALPVNKSARESSMKALRRAA